MKNPHVQRVYAACRNFQFNPYSTLLNTPERMKSARISRRSQASEDITSTGEKIKQFISQILVSKPMPDFVFRQLLTLPPEKGAIETFLAGQIHRCLRELPNHRNGRVNTPMEFQLTIEFTSHWLAHNLQRVSND